MAELVSSMRKVKLLFFLNFHLVSGDKPCDTERLKDPGQIPMESAVSVVAKLPVCDLIRPQSVFKLK